MGDTTMSLEQTGSSDAVRPGTIVGESKPITADVAPCDPTPANDHPTYESLISPFAGAFAP
jgi:hypothetical protein